MTIYNQLKLKQLKYTHELSKQPSEFPKELADFKPLKKVPSSITRKK